MKPTVFYVEKQPVAELHEHILKHLPRMQYWYEWQGCELVYLPLHQLNSVEWDSIRDYLAYQFPFLNRDEFTEVISTLKEPTHLLVNRLLIKTQLEHAPHDAFLIYTDGVLQQGGDSYQVLSKYQRGVDSVETFFISGFETLWATQPQNFSRTKSSLSENEFFHFNSFEKLGEINICFDIADAPNEVTEEVLSAEIKARLDALVAAGEKSQILDVVTYLLNNLSPYLQANSSSVLKLLEDHWAEYAVARRPSRLFIDRHTRIFLTDFGNLEIELNPLCKTLFLFYLKHPEGVSFPCLSDHRQELQQIYSKITNRSNLVEIEASVAALVNPLDNSIHEKCARIKGAFRARMHISIASPYLIEGPRGGLKGISLDRSLVTYEVEPLQACRE